jgi:hypothetical protein
MGSNALKWAYTYYHQLPEPVRLVCTAIIGAGIGWVTYEIIYWINPLVQSRATTSWALAFLIGVAGSMHCTAH